MNGREESVEFIHTKDRIIQSALKLFSRKGFRGTTIKDIAHEVGVTEGAIYRHFQSKEDLIEHITEKIVGEIDLLLEEEVLSRENFKEQIEALIESLACYAFNNPDSFRYLAVYHLLRNDIEEKERTLPGMKILDLLRKAHSEGKLDIHPEVALGIITGTINRIFVIKELGLSSISEEELIGEMKRSILRSLALESDL
jgi:AcrR family transcriptional regulator